MRISLKPFLRSLPLLIYLIVCILPSISRRISSTVLLVVILLLLLSSVRKVMKINLALLLCWGVMALFLILQHFRVSGINAIGNLYENVLFFLPILYYSLGNKMDEDKEILLVLFAYMALQTYVAVYNIRLLLVYPYLSKYMTAGVGYVVSGYRYTDLGSVSNVFSSVCVSVFALHIIRKQKTGFWRILFMGIFAINGMFVILARSTLCLVVFVWGILLLVGGNKKASRFFIVLLTILSLAIILVFSGAVQEIIENTSMALDYKRRALDILSFVRGDQDVDSLGYINGRFWDYAASLSTFVHHPLFGVGMIYSTDVSVIGMHSEVLDFLARYGILGLILFGALYRLYVNETRLRESALYTPLILVLLLYAILNPFISRTSGIALFWIIPIIKTLYYKEKTIDDTVCLE